MSVIHAALDIESVVDRAEHSIDFVQALREPADKLFSAIGQVHQLDEVEEALQGDHLILFSLVEWFEDRRIVLEVGVQLQVVDREQRHRCVEVLFLLQGEG